jgi:hypothetical protein
MPQMWIPCVVFAHLFAFSFMLSMFKVSNPAVWESAKRRLLCRGKRPSADGTAPTAAAIAAATAAQRQGEQCSSSMKTGVSGDRLSCCCWQSSHEAGVIISSATVRLGRRLTLVQSTQRAGFVAAQQHFP